MNNEQMGGAPQTPVLKPVVTAGGPDDGAGSTLSTEQKQATGKMCIVGKNYEY